MLLPHSQLGGIMARPKFNAYTVREYEKDGKKDSFWTKIGVAFEHKNGGGFDVVLEAFPINGRITLREPKADEPAEPTA
jgi:hypothetical protein